MGGWVVVIEPRAVLFLQYVYLYSGCSCHLACNASMLLALSVENSVL